MRRMAFWLLSILLLLVAFYFALYIYPRLR